MMKILKTSQNKLAKFRASLFRVGDRVTLVNCYGVGFHGNKIIEIEPEETSYGGQFCLDNDAPWYPTRVSHLRIERATNNARGLIIYFLELFVPLTQKKLIYR